MTRITRRLPTTEGERTLVIAYHKPRGLLTTHADELGRETVYDRLRARLPPALAQIPWHAIGRLDQDTTGLLLFTNDGALVHHATQPTTKLVKTYTALAKGILTDDTVARLRAGVPLTGGLGTSGPAEVEITAFQAATTWVTIRISEGKNRQIRRMLLAVGSQVIRLARTHIGSLALDLPEDAWRLLGDDEIQSALGYTPRVIRRGQALRALRERIPRTAPPKRPGPRRAEGVSEDRSGRESSDTVPGILPRLIAADRLSTWLLRAADIVSGDGLAINRAFSRSAGADGSAHCRRMTSSAESAFRSPGCRRAAGCWMQSPPSARRR